ncbi:MAG: ribonuclease [Erysipelotrichaceae bacterium]|jgi:hypothetical protein|nr:ribonuclease [Erysipelotrichaceae bacterium]
MKKIIRTLITLLFIGALLFIGSRFLFQSQAPIDEPVIANEEKIDIDGSYTSKEDVALYIATYGKLPGNFVTKSQAKDMGWVASKGNLQKVCEGCSIGGDRFGNREGLLPDKKGRKYYECDIDYRGGTRNEKRIVFSNDGLIYYTDDHFSSFELLYGEP